MPQQSSRIPHAATNIWHSQINKQTLKTRKCSQNVNNQWTKNKNIWVSTELFFQIFFRFNLKKEKEKSSLVTEKRQSTVFI